LNRRGWRKLYNYDLHNLYSSPSVIKIIKLWWKRWAGHVARRGRREKRLGYWRESQKERDQVCQDIGW
jgi:hypothetical protein